LFGAFQHVSLVDINKSKLLFYENYNKYKARSLILTNKNYPKRVLTVYCSQ